MVKYTTTIYEYLQSELINADFNEFFNDNQLSFNDENTYMNKILSYDSDVESIITNRIFRGLTLTDPTADRHFKQMFTYRFLNREIGRQTIEDFASQVCFTFSTMGTQLNYWYANAENILNNGHTTDNQSRSLMNDLPQETINMDVTNDLMPYASTNDATNTHTDVTIYDLETLTKSLPFFEKVFSTFDRRCFLQVW